MADASYADAVLSRFSGGGVAPAGAADDGDEAPDGGADEENGRMLAQAIKRGDNAAICEAVRRICGM